MKVFADAFRESDSDPRDCDPDQRYEPNSARTAGLQVVSQVESRNGEFNRHTRYTVSYLFQKDKCDDKRDHPIHTCSHTWKKVWVLFPERVAEELWPSVMWA
jgi:hypothetical protein